MMASKVQRGPRWLSLMAAILGASKGIASCSRACSTRSFSSTNKNSACGSTNFLISQGQATRSTLMSFLVIHFIFTSRAPGIREFNGETVFVEVRNVCRNYAGKALARCIDYVQIAVRQLIPAQANVCARRLLVGS